MGPSVDRRAESIDVNAGLANLLRMPGDPELPEVRCRFRMELDAPRFGAFDAEGLVRSEHAPREQLGAGRELEDVVMPLVDAGRVREMAEDGIVRGLLRRLDVDPADLGLGSGPDLATERPREKLGAETDTEHGHALIDGVPKQEPLGAQERDAVLVPSMGIATQRDDRGEIAWVDILDSLVPGAQAPVRHAGGVEPLAEQPQAPEGVLLLDDEDCPHEPGR